MRFQNIVFVLLISIVFTGCGSCESQPPQPTKKTPIPIASASPSGSQTPVENVNTDENNQMPPKAGEPEVIEKPKERVEAVTLKPLIALYCEAMRNGDNARLQKVFSTESLKAMRADMRAEGKATLADYLEGEPVGNKCEVVNEEINGNSATALVITQTYPKGVTFDFVKENNEWKMTNQSEEFDRVDQN